MGLWLSVDLGRTRSTRQPVQDTAVASDRLVDDGPDNQRMVDTLLMAGPLIGLDRGSGSTLVQSGKGGDGGRRGCRHGACWDPWASVQLSSRPGPVVSAAKS